MHSVCDSGVSGLDLEAILAFPACPCESAALPSPPTRAYIIGQRPKVVYGVGRCTMDQGLQDKGPFLARLDAVQTCR